jgi:hypothetical protein
MQQIPFCEADSCLVRQNIPYFLWIENFIGVFKEAPTRPYPEPVESSPHFCFFKIEFSVICSQLVLPVGLFLSAFPSRF